MSKIILATLLSLLLGACTACADAPSDAARLNAYRGWEDRSFVYDVQISPYRGGKPSETPRIGRIYFRSHAEILINFFSPQSFDGRRVLFVGQQLWLSLPTIARPLRVTAQDRLAGQADIADVLNVDTSRYSAAYGKSAAIGGKTYRRLVLTSKSDGNAYARIDFLVDPATDRPFEGFYYASSGMLLKTADFTRFGSFDGRELVTQMVLHDPVFKGRTTVVDFGNYALKPLPSSMFRKASIRQPLPS